MASVGVREPKNELSESLDRVAAGEVLTVTRRGKPIARLVPVRIPEHLALWDDVGVLASALDVGAERLLTFGAELREPARRERLDVLPA